MNDHLREQVLLLLIGAFVGVLPGTIQTVLQAKAQQQQVLFNQQIEALKGFSMALSDNAQLFSKEEELELLLDSLDSLKQLEKGWPRIRQLMDEKDVLKNQYIAKLHTASLVMTAVFGVRIPVLNYREVPLPEASDLQGKSKKEQHEALDRLLTELRTDVHDEHDFLIKYIQQYEEFVEKVGSRINR